LKTWLLILMEKGFRHMKISFYSLILYSAVGINILFSTFIVPPCISAEIVSTDRHLVRYESGVVYDTETGLEWFSGPDQGMSWQEAESWVNGLNKFGGEWRMPNREELETLYTVGDGVKNITPLLHNTGYWVWAGQTKEKACKWIFNFSYGGEGWDGQAPAGGGRAIAVRHR
jgi:hypothetical protein